MIRGWRLSLVLACLAFLLGCGGAPRRGEPPSSEREARAALDALSARYIERSFAWDPGSAVYAGRHEHDGEIVDYRPSALAAWVEELRGFRREAEAIAASALDPARRTERAYLLALVDASLFWLVRLKQHESSPLAYANAIDPSVYLTRPYAPLDVRLAAYVKHAHNVPRVVDTMIANLRTPLPRTFVQVGLSVFGGLEPYLARDVPAIFASVLDAERRETLARANTVALAAIARAKTFLEAQQATATDSFALGPDLFREMLWATERVDTPLEALRAEGERDLARNFEALRGECQKLLPGGTLEACAALVGDDKPSEGPVAAARAQVPELKRFVATKQLVSIPGEEEALVEEAPPYKRYNAAYIEIPGPYERGLPSTYYIAPPDPGWSEVERTAYVPGRMDLLFITVHEVWPGHFLQFLHANRSERALGRVFVGYAFAEGWAHYAEELMWEAGLGEGDPKTHVGQLLNALLRNVRFVSALGLHTGGMTVAASERLFREQALCDPGNARQQAARGTFDPAYLNYTLGKLVIRKLRDDWLRTQPAGDARAQLRAFHDRLLSFGGPPLPLVREAMLGTREGAL